MWCVCGFCCWGELLMVRALLGERPMPVRAHITCPQVCTQSMQARIKQEGDGQCVCTACSL